ncbi:MAG: transposase [Bryobacteraceae bacterium]
MPAHLKRERIVHNLAEAETVGASDHGAFQRYGGAGARSELATAPVRPELEECGDDRERAVDYGLRHRARPLVHVIGINEVSRRKGQVYPTVVYDLERRVLVWVGEDRTEEAVRKFFTEEMAAGAAIRCRWFAWTCGRRMPAWYGNTR